MKVLPVERQSSLGSWGNLQNDSNYFPTSFSVHALKNGFKHSINVDLSKSVIKKSKNNFILNELKCDNRDFIYGDAIEWINIFKKKNRYFSFIVFDPPTFSRNRRRFFSVVDDYSASLKLLSTISDRGYIFTSINSFTISKDEYIKFHPSNWELVMLRGESSDFINKGDGYLKAGLWKIS